MRKLTGVLAVVAVLTASSSLRAHEGDPLHTIQYLAAQLLNPVLDLVFRAADIDPEEPNAGIDPTRPTGCDPLDPVRCLLPFPNDFFTVKDAKTDTGRRVSFALNAMPRNVAGKPIDPTEWNRNDGFSPGSMVLTWVPGLDLDQTGAPRITAPQDSIATNAGAPSSPIIVLNADTGELHPVFAELDENLGARITIEEAADLIGADDYVPEPAGDQVLFTPATQDHERLLILRPLRNFDENTRYIVALRRLKDPDGNEILPGPAFLALREAYLATRDLPEAPVDGLSRVAHYADDVFPVLEAAGIPVEDLHLAWDFTVASERNLSERALHIRDKGFRELNGGAPAFTVGGSTDDPNGTSATSHTARRVTGSFQVPSFLDLPGGAPGSRLNYIGTPDGNRPARNPLGDFVTANFICNIPRSVLDVASPTKTIVQKGLPTLYGHGLLGSANENNSGHARNMANQGELSMCATDWDGMSGEDLATIATILADVSNFPKLADRSQQGFLNFMYLGRLMLHPDGFCTDPAFQDDAGECVFDQSREQVYYDGNSQGAIMGGSLVALAHDVRRGVLGVPGMNYSTLLNRSVDWENAFAYPFYVAYPDKMDQQIAFALMQMLWDRAETNGYAHHATSDPYPDPSPADDAFHAAKSDPTAFGDKQIILHVAWADHQVTPLAAEVEARTMGAEFITSSLYAPNHWETAPYFQLPTLSTPSAAADRKSAIVYWHNGNNVPPNGNQPPDESNADPDDADCRDPHESPRRDPRAVAQKKAFYHTGVIDDVCDGKQCQTGFRRDCENGNQPGAVTEPHSPGT